MVTRRALVVGDRHHVVDERLDHVQSGFHLKNTKLTPFRDRTWRFFFEQTYSWDPTAVRDGRDAVSRLIRHQSYQFASPIPGGTVESVDAITGKPRHGPYNLDCITEAAYEQTDGPSALAYLLHSIDEESRTYVDPTPPVPTPDVALEALQRLEITLASATEVFRLRELEEHCYARHRYLGAWCELVVADSNARELKTFMSSSD
jgi:hypothetical protein